MHSFSYWNIFLQGPPYESDIKSNKQIHLLAWNAVLPPAYTKKLTDELTTIRSRAVVSTWENKVQGSTRPRWNTKPLLAAVLSLQFCFKSLCWLTLLECFEEQWGTIAEKSNLKRNYREFRKKVGQDPGREKNTIPRDSMKCSVAIKNLYQKKKERK